MSKRRRTTHFIEDDWQRVTAALHLSPREAQLVRLVYEGLKDAAMALRLCISVRTVRKHFERLYRKVAVHNRATLMIRIFEARESSAKG